MAHDQHLWSQCLLPYVDLQDLQTLTLVNQEFNDLINSDETWRIRAVQHIPSCLQLKPPEETFHQFYLRMIQWKPADYTWERYDRELIWSFGPPTKVDSKGNNEWYRHGQLHRDGDKPAVIHRYYCEWHVNGVRVL